MRPLCTGELGTAERERKGEKGGEGERGRGGEGEWGRRGEGERGESVSLSIHTCT